MSQFPYLLSAKVPLQNNPKLKPDLNQTIRMFVYNLKTPLLHQNLYIPSTRVKQTQHNGIVYWSKVLGF